MLPKNLSARLTYCIIFCSLLFITVGCIQKNIFPSTYETSVKTEKEEEEKDKYDGPEMIARMEYERTKDPRTGRVPRENLLIAIEQARLSKLNALNRPDGTQALSWTERGPSSDVPGPFNGNTRANGGIAAGRVRAIMVDSTDATKKTVWAGGVDGGLWKTTDITVSPANWILVNDFLSNLAVSDICQDPRPGFKNIMYFCTGESYFNFDAVQGNGVFKSTDGGTTWNYLSSTSAYTNCTRIRCDFQGNIYLATRGTGLLRSTAASGGAAWTNITPTGLVADICDMEISSTVAAGRLHVVTGIFSTQAYRYTDIPATVAAGTWTAPATAFPSFAMRAEIACSGNTLYALPANGSYQVPTIYKSTDGGANWTATGGQPTAGWGAGQAWYNLSVAIDPSNANNCIVGALDNWKTTNGGTSWTKLSEWVGLGGQYVHADVHNITWYDGGNKLLFGCDGGVHYSSDKGTTIRDRNIGLRIKQFYSCAIHPTTTDYFLAGAQDNGVHQFSNPGLSNTIEVTGGDGGFVAIDQNQPQFQFGSYIFNDYRRSTDGGTSWTSVTLNGSTGQFINPFDYDNTANIMYCGDVAGAYRRWTDPQTGATSAAVSITSLGGGNVLTVSVSPYTANRVYLGTDNGRVVIVDAANTIASGSAGSNISTGLPSGSLSCINQGTNDQNLVAVYSNYGINNVWISTNGGTSWTASDGNLPNMPVRWAMFYPGNNTKAIIATETGVWETNLLNGASTVWTANSSFPNVRTDMLEYRPLDGTVAAATHGRGLWTTIIHPIFNLPMQVHLLPKQQPLPVDAEATRIIR
jgi:trimeric autotransporter adhesin